ncbi:MAG: phosphatase PAP2 family protein [Gemmatimonadales bacterium]|nr:phosphatase PAP2 family protein [Gemmatimonadales bacterium]
MAVAVRPAEWLLAGYAAFVTIVGLGRLERHPAVAWAVAAHVLLLALLFMFQRLPAGRGSWLRNFGPIVLLLALYGALDLLNGFGGARTYDDTVLAWERWVFGEEVSRLWWQRWNDRLASTVFHAAYFSYYLIVPIPVVIALFRRDEAELSRTLFALMAVFVLCYVLFILAPVAGPYYEYPRPDQQFLDNWAAQAVYGVLDRGSSFGAAFPSSHVAASWIATAATWRSSKAIGWVVGLLSALLTIGVVYCQMHYAIDALAGLVVAAAVFGLTRAVFTRRANPTH